MSDSQYAGFLIRFLAFIIDTAILFVAILIIQVFFNLPMRVGSFNNVQPLTPAVLGFNLAAVVGVWLYYSLFESSKWQATLGKRFCKIKVIDYHGNRISFGRATGRYFAKYLSSIIFCIGYFMIIFTKKKQALHDMIAKTLVIRD